MMGGSTKRGAVWACLLAAAAFLTLASCGCDGGAFVRMDIRQGAMAEVRVVPVAELEQFGGRPIPAARVAFHTGPGLSAEEATLSERDGVVATDIFIWGMRWGKAFDRLEVGFTCTKDGYQPVAGLFRLKGFGGLSPDGPDQTVLVFMTPVETAREAVEATEDPPSH